MYCQERNNILLKTPPAYRNVCLMNDAPSIVEVTIRGETAQLVLSGEPEALTLPAEIVRAGNLAPGVQLTPSQWTQLKETAERYHCDQSAMQLLAVREHSTGELRLKLRRKGFARQVIEVVVRRMTAIGAVDDVRYAHLVGQSLLQRRPCSRAYLSAHLQRRHVPRELAESVAEVLLGDTDELALAEAALGQRRSLSQFELETARRKAYNYLARRGFGFEAARIAFERWYKQLHQESHD